MTYKEIQELIQEYWVKESVGSSIGWLYFSTQYDDRSAAVNYGMVRKYKPSVVVEFGTRTGRCTHDILKALIKNGNKFIYKPYELEDSLRKTAQDEINRIFGENAVTIGGDITKATDLPKDIEYLFVDNYHDMNTTKWVFEYLIPNHCKDGCIVQIHDITFKGDFDHMNTALQEEEAFILDLHKSGKLPLNKLYWMGDEGNPNIQSSWWIYKNESNNALLDNK